MNWEKLKPRIDNFLVYVLYPAMLCFDALPIVSVYVRICTMLIMLINIFYYKWTIYRGIYDEFKQYISYTTDWINYNFETLRWMDRMLHAETKRERFSGITPPYRNDRVKFMLMDIYSNCIRSRGFKDFSSQKTDKTTYYQSFGTLMFFNGGIKISNTIRREDDMDEFSVIVKV